ncbi:hypothetical protein LEP3755_33930 [Leptolyngbya sp. NIES-3755]|nr:hypothetical protein LEP3755_33930 [Leptolyngbya sp. NIES-3755]
MSRSTKAALLSKLALAASLTGGLLMGKPNPDAIIAPRSIAPIVMEAQIKPVQKPIEGD